MQKNTRTILIIIGIILILIACVFCATGSGLLFVASDNSDTNQEFGGNNEVIVYEEVVKDEEDCTEYEEYNAETSVCYFECETEEKCDEINAKIDARLDNWAKEYGEFSKNLNEDDTEELNIDEDAEIVYEIDKGETYSILNGSEDARHKQIKNWLIMITPNDFSNKYYNKLIAYTSSENKDTIAYVLPDENEAKWDVYVNMDNYKLGEKEMLFTLIHEFTHILTLNVDQQENGVVESSCSQYFVDEGCMSKTSYLNMFYSKFWEGKYKENIDDPYKNYVKEENSFVTEYAATNSAEDIAESFALFVFNQKNNTPKTIADQKVNFFYDYPELVELRAEMRNKLKLIERRRIASEVNTDL